MMMKLSEIRTKYPQYDDLSDQQLADALHKKYPQLSKTDLYKRIGFKVTTQKPTASKPLDLKKVATNIPESAVQLGKDIVYPIMNPVQTGKAIGGLGQGMFQKLLRKDPFTFNKPVSQQEKMVDAVKNMYGERYGDWEKTKRTLEKDPVGLLADATTILTAGGAAASRLPGIAGQIGSKVQSVARKVDPINVPLKTVGGVVKATKAATPAILGLYTGAGTDAIKEAVKAGRESTINFGRGIKQTIKLTKDGRARADTFLKFLRGRGDLTEPLEMAQNAFKNLVKGRGSTYKKGMDELSGNQKVIPFSMIDDAVEKVSREVKFKGEEFRKVPTEVVDEVKETVARWKALDPAEFHTADGLDKLKISIGDILTKHQPDSPAYFFTKQVYDGIKKSINEADPRYARIMEDYTEATKALNQIKKSLSIGAETTNIDSAIRKLTSLMRNNVSTNFGYRKLLAEKLVEAGADRLFPAISGQALNPIAPTGISRADLNPATLMLRSPRATGEAAYYLGKGSAPFVPIAKGLEKGAVPTGRGLLQAGRIEQEAERLGLLDF